MILTGDQSFAAWGKCSATGYSRPRYWIGPAPRDHDEYPQPFLPAEGEAQGRDGTCRRSSTINLTRVGNFR